VKSPFDDRIPQHTAKALDLHWLSPIIRDLVFTLELCCFLELPFERRALVTQSLTFLRGSAQAHHLDTLYVAYSLPMQFVASWIALEDVAAGAGELSYFAGSHQLPEHLFLDEYKSISELVRMQRAASLQRMVWPTKRACRSWQKNMGCQSKPSGRRGVIFWSGMRG
jgi:hypothetical protein